MCFQPPINLSCELLEIPAIFPVLPKNSGKPVKKRDRLSTLFSKRARAEKKIILEAPAYSGLIKAFDYLENCNRRIFNHGWVNFPLAYTQASQFSITNLIQYFIFAGVLISKLIKT